MPIGNNGSMGFAIDNISDVNKKAYTLIKEYRKELCENIQINSEACFCISSVLRNKNVDLSEYQEMTNYMVILNEIMSMAHRLSVCAFKCGLNRKGEELSRLKMGLFGRALDADLIS